MIVRSFAAALLALGCLAAQADTKPHVYFDCGSPSGNAILDLACNIYFEARNQPEAGKYLVGFATRNRVENKHYPSTYSDVVYEVRKDRRTGKPTPMFSWTLDGKVDKVHNPVAWCESVRIAYEIITEDLPDFSMGAMWYHADYVNPYWAGSYHKTVAVGDHIFYAASEQAAQKAMLANLRRGRA